MNKKLGQIWVETVLYTLIGLALIGVVLAIITPKINQQKDRIIIEQSIDVLNEIDGKITEILDRGVGNVRTISLLIKKGNLEINAKEEKITLEIDDLSKPYSEVGQKIKISNVEIISQKTNKENIVFLTLNYTSRANLTYSGSDDFVETLSSSNTPYNLIFENKGLVGDSVQVNIVKT